VFVVFYTNAGRATRILAHRVSPAREAAAHGDGNGDTVLGLLLYEIQFG
jgi:hypothetical protein